MIFLFYPTLSPCQGKILIFKIPAFHLIKPSTFLYFKNREYVLKKEDTLVDLAVKFGVGYRNLVLANPGVDPWVPPPGKKIIIPFEILLPPYYLKSGKEFVLINLPEMRLYYFKRGKFFVAPVGVGVKGSLPPEGVYLIIKKKKDPVWYPPPSIRKEDPDLPEKVPPGPDNPMGKYALYLSRGMYAIHGTNKIYSIGRRTTHGCIRLYPWDIKFLFKNVPVGTLVRIVYDPYKIAIQKRKIYLQAFPDIEKKIKHPVLRIIKLLDKLLRNKRENYRINLLKLEKYLKHPDGLVHTIGIVYRD